MILRNVEIRRIYQQCFFIKIYIFRPMTTLQRTQNRSDQRLYRVAMQSLPQCRMASVPNAMSSAAQGNAGFFV